MMHAKIAALYPEAKYYVQRISFEKLFGSTPIDELVRKLASGGDELAQHLLCSPDYIVMPRSTKDPRHDALYLRVFDGSIHLAEWERLIYEQYYPTDRFLLIAPEVPECALLSAYLTSGAISK